MSFLITSYKSAVLLKTATREKENKESMSKTHITARSVHTEWFRVPLCCFKPLGCKLYKKKGKESLKDKVKKKKKKKEKVLCGKLVQPT